MGVPPWELDELPISYMRQAIIIEAAEHKASEMRRKIEAAEKLTQTTRKPLKIGRGSFRRK